MPNVAPGSMEMAHSPASASYETHDGWMTRHRLIRVGGLVVELDETVGPTLPHRLGDDGLVIAEAGPQLDFVAERFLLHGDRSE
jgi:hypothetical protein